MKRLTAIISVLLAAATVAAAQSADSLSTLLDKATAYVSNYVTTLSSVVSEERYEQTVRRLVARGDLTVRENETRVLLSDYLLVQVPGSREWMPFRDVYLIDGRKIHDRDNRLLRLFVEPRTASWARALEIRAESSRFNIGDVTRDINVPTFALQVLDPKLRPGFAFLDKGREKIDGVDVAVVEFQETARPTLILGDKDENVPSSGRLWIRPDDGAVLRTQLETRPTGMHTRIVVDYGYDPNMKILVPTEMNEEHGLLQQTVKGRATYSKFRRFQVETKIEIK